MDIVVGIDVSKDRLDVHVSPLEESFVVGRDAAGLTALHERLKTLDVACIGIEATGGYEAIVVASLGGAGLPVVVLNPAQVRAFAKAVGQRAETDPIDARLIARFVAATRPEIRPLAHEATRLLAELVARRAQIVAMITAERQRKRQATNPRLLKSLTRILTALDKELATIEAEIDDAVRGSPVWREKEDLLASVPGVGPQTARRLIADMPELGTLSRRKIAALAGLAPFTRQSGRWRGKSFIAGGRATVRCALFMAAMVAVKHNPILKAFADRRKATGMSRLAAITASARKLLTILNAILRDKKPWKHA